MRRPKGLMPMENMLEYGPLPLPGGYQVIHDVMTLVTLVLCSSDIHYYFSSEEGKEAKSVCSIWWEKVSWIFVQSENNIRRHEIFLGQDTYKKAYFGECGEYSPVLKRWELPKSGRVGATGVF